MDPSHTRKYNPADIENTAVEILNGACPDGIEPPIEIDILVERHPSVDDLIAAQLGDFNVVASLICKPNTDRFDIFFDEDAVFGRISFSIAHEFGHVVLHTDLCKNCHNVQAVIALHNHLKELGCYGRIEREANRFAGAILMPRGHLCQDTKLVYQGLVEQYGFEKGLIEGHLCPTLARRYEVTNSAMQVRLDQLGFQREIQHAIQHKFTTLDLAL